MSRTMRRIAISRTPSNISRTGKMKWYANRRRQQNRSIAQRYALSTLLDLAESQKQPIESNLTAAVKDRLTQEGCPSEKFTQAYRISVDAIRAAQRNLGRETDTGKTVMQEACRILSDQPIGRISLRGAVTVAPESHLRKEATDLRRDANVTGLRAEDHRRNRRETRRDLRDTDKAENVRAGKSRRYGEKYGDYEF